MDDSADMLALLRDVLARSRDGQSARIVQDDQPIPVAADGTATVSPYLG